MADQADGIMISPDGMRGLAPRGVVLNVMDHEVLSATMTNSSIAEKNGISSSPELGTAGILKAGSRKMPMNGSRLILPRFSWSFGQSKTGPLDETPVNELQDQFGPKEEVCAVFVAKTDSPNKRETRSQHNFVTCSECGITQEFKEDCQFQCYKCQAKLAAQRTHAMMVSSELSKELAPLEEGCDDQSHEEEDAAEEEERTHGAIHKDPEQPLDQPPRPNRLSNFMRRFSSNLRVSSGSSNNSSGGENQHHSSSDASYRHDSGDLDSNNTSTTKVNDLMLDQKGDVPSNPALEQRASF
ncbi:hypothetical protein ACA910_022283 [Epithemia clementina (nom. ined.)]